MEFITSCDLVIPHKHPTTELEHSENMLAIERWARHYRMNCGGGDSCDNEIYGEFFNQVSMPDNGVCAREVTLTGPATVMVICTVKADPDSGEVNVFPYVEGDGWAGPTFDVILGGNGPHQRKAGTGHYVVSYEEPGTYELGWKVFPNNPPPSMTAMLSITVGCYSGDFTPYMIF